MATLITFLLALMLCVVTFTLPNWRMFREQHHPPILSVAAGTALAYVFLALLPKLASIQAQVQASTAVPRFLEKELAYLAVLTGLIMLLVLTRKDLSTGIKEGTNWSPGAVVVATIFSLYHAQVGYFLGEWPFRGLLASMAVGGVFGLHLTGINFHIWHHYPQHYLRHFRGIFCLFLLLGWLSAVVTDRLYGVMEASTAFIAGVIVMTAIREELPSNENVHLPLFLGSVIVTAFVILVL